MLAGALVLLGVVVVAAIVVGAIVLATKGKADFHRANEVVPGVASPAPAAWAGSHDPEARLHRRLRDAMTALRANQAFDDDGGLLDLRVDLEQQAIALDTQLVAIAGLAPDRRPEQLARAEQSVAAIEGTVASLVGVSAGETEARMSRLLGELQGRTGAVSDARRELDGPGGQPSGDQPSGGTATGAP